jgi:HNH endonuclease
MERIWRRVDKSGDCWLWQGSIDHRGYGQINAGGDRGTKLVHRLVYEDANGPIPAGRYVCHTCDNPQCVNPAHLWCGTSRDNALDMIAKGRHWAQKR